MNTQENNRLIAEFMNLDMYPPHDDYPLLYDCSLIDQDPQWYALEEFQYHTSWDWLMPVIEEIDHLEYESERLDKINQALVTKVIEDVYNAVVEFIKWYNQNKQTMKLEVTSVRYFETRRDLGYQCTTNVNGVEIWNDGNGGATYITGGGYTLHESELEQLIDNYELPLIK